jgi:hypothetical protein
VQRLFRHNCHEQFWLKPDTSYPKSYISYHEFIVCFCRPLMLGLPHANG